MNLEKIIIEHCSPTLAGIKTANLFTVKCQDMAELQNYIQGLGKTFSKKGISVRIVKQKIGTALIYIYRENMLKNDLANFSAKKILIKYGYRDFSPSSAIERLIGRLNSYEEFPHEIGLFLGYPPADVEGFICHKGKNCKLCRYWKVYGDEEDALIKFAKYDKCRAIYYKLWQSGKDILQLTVKNPVVA